MQVTAVRDLPFQPRDIAVLPTGELLAFSWSVAGMHLDAYDPDLGAVWSRSLDPRARGLRLDQHGTPWVIDLTGASAFSDRGEFRSRIEAPVLDGMEVASLTFVETDVVIAYQHQEAADPVRPALIRMTRDGTLRWTSRLTADSVSFARDAGDRRTSEARDPFQPSAWVCGYMRAGNLVAAGDTLLVVYEDMPRTGIAVGYAISLADGMVRYVTEPGFIHQVAARGSGAFLVCYMGPDLAGTVLYEGNGAPLGRWKTQGDFVVDGSDIRVIERGLPMSRLARLNPDGAVIRGDLIEGYQTSHPYLHADGTVYFARQGMLHAVRDLAIEDRIVVSGLSHSDAIFHTRVLAAADGLFCTSSSNRQSGPVLHTSSLARVLI